MNLARMQRFAYSCRLYRMMYSHLLGEVSPTEMLLRHTFWACRKPRSYGEKSVFVLNEVQVGEVHRDIDAISLAGIPIVTYQGVDGGIGIAEGYKFDKSLFTTDEVFT